MKEQSITPQPTEMKSAEEVFSKVNGFSAIGDNVSITLTKRNIYEAMETYASQYKPNHSEVDWEWDIAFQDFCIENDKNIYKWSDEKKLILEYQKWLKNNFTLTKIK